MNQQATPGRTRSTIAALATPAGAGGIAIVRISGPRAWEVGRRLFRPSAGPLPHNPPPRRLLHGQVIDPQNSEVVDEVLCAFFRAPHSYTTEDTVEIQGHAGPAVAQRVLELALAAGCRLARPGEFTLRAFLGGRIDLSQAEAVAQLVQAQSQVEARLALGGLQGGLARELQGVRQALLHTAAQVEACLDFPDEVPEIDPGDLARRLGEGVLGPMQGLIRGRLGKRVFREGGVVVICGRPNVGKSSLFNSLLGGSRAIVSSRPGTTRDAIEESITCGGVVMRLVDTAGLGTGRDELEALGMAQTRDRLGLAHLALVVLDTSQPLGEPDRRVLEETAGQTRLICLNKADLPRAWGPEQLGLTGETMIPASAKEGSGVDELARALARALTGGQREPQPGEVVVSQRQAQALERGLEACRQAQGLLEQPEPPFEMVSLELARALEFLGQVDGQGAPGQVIEAVFENFCVGK